MAIAWAHRPALPDAARGFVVASCSHFLTTAGIDFAQVQPDIRAQMGVRYDHCRVNFSCNAVLMDTAR